MTPSASPWCGSIAGRRAFAAPDAAATPWYGTAATTRSRTGNATGASDARVASTISPARCWPGTTSRCGSGCGKTPGSLSLLRGSRIIVPHITMDPPGSVYTAPLDQVLAGRHLRGATGRADRPTAHLDRQIPGVGDLFDLE